MEATGLWCFTIRRT